MIDRLFDICVEMLVIMGDAIGMTYEEINIWLFVVLMPIVFIVQAVTIWILVVLLIRKNKTKNE